MKRVGIQGRDKIMIFHIITIFPEAFESFLSHSIVGKAHEKWLFEVKLYKLNEFSPETSGHIDDKAFGMHGQVLRPEPLARAIEHIQSIVGNVDMRSKIPVIYMSPSWKILDQQGVEKFSQDIKECIIICGHYEGIDQRIIDLYVDHEISIGNYVLSGGEIASQVFIDSLIRNIPWVLGNTISLQEESFSEKLDRQKEYPVYTRPQVFKRISVPSILLSGDHKKIEQWKSDNLR